MSFFDQSRRERKLRREQAKRLRAERKKNRAEVKAKNNKWRHRAFKTSADNEKIHTFKVMFISSVLLTLVALGFLVYSGVYDWSTHAMNMADNTFAFVVGLLAMDLITYFNMIGRQKRDENRAIIRYHRLNEPLIDSFVARKNALTTLSSEPFDQYSVIRDFDIKAFVEMFESSVIASDAGMTKIDAFAFHQKQLYKSFQKMVEDVDFSYYPEACDAALDFINASAIGFASLAALQSLELNENRTRRTALLKILKEISANPEDEKLHPEAMSVFMLIQSIRDEQRAIDQYLDSVASIVDPDN